MLNFKKTEISDIGLLARVFDTYKGRICDYSAGNAVFWGERYDTSYYLGEDGFVMRFGRMGGIESYTFPISDRPFVLIDRLLEDNGGDVCISCMTRDEYERVSKKYTVTEVFLSEAWNDYLYLAQDIVTLHGRRFNGQRNHVNKFKKSYPDYKFEIITSENADKAALFCREYFHGIGKSTMVSDYEERKLCEQFDNWDAYAQLGGMLSASGKVVGISVGELVNDTLIVHTEKADTSYEGVYPMLTHSFAVCFASDERCKYINREEDCGEEGLRISKMSYHPIQMLEKYTVRLKA